MAITISLVRMVESFRREEKTSGEVSQPEERKMRFDLSRQDLLDTLS